MPDTVTAAPRRGKKSRSLPACIAASLLVGVLALFLLSLFGAIVAYRSEDPTSLLTPVSYAVGCTAALLCGYAGGRLYGRSGLLCGLLSGVAFLCLYLLGFAVLSGDVTPAPGKLLLSFSILFALCVLGGAFGGRRRTPRPRHAKHRR